MSRCDRWSEFGGGAKGQAWESLCLQPSRIASRGGRGGVRFDQDAAVGQALLPRPGKLLYWACRRSVRPGFN